MTRTGGFYTFTVSLEATGATATLLEKIETAVNEFGDTIITNASADDRCGCVRVDGQIFARKINEESFDARMRKVLDTYDKFDVHYLYINLNQPSI